MACPYQLDRSGACRGLIWSIFGRSVVALALENAAKTKRQNISGEPLFA